MTHRLLVVFETAWDRRQLEACRASWADRYSIEFAQPSDADADWDFDVVGYIESEAERRRGRIDGVFSTSDYPGATVAAAIATRLGLPGPTPEAVLGASHKYHSRVAQREAAPEAVPGFGLVDPEDPATWSPPFGFPCFIKPVKGAFSVMTGQMGSEDELRAFVTGPRAVEFRTSFMNLFDQLTRHFGLEHGGRFFLVEELLRGYHVTVEGWRSPTREGILGIVDSTFEPGTASFVRFDYPSALPAHVQERMGAIALAVTARQGLVSTLFNVEMTWNPRTDRIGIIEVNPRACGQFADLYQKVDGVNGFELALALAAGLEPPEPSPGAGAFRVASSFPFRVFRTQRVLRAPDAAAIRAMQDRHPGTLVWPECSTGDLLDLSSVFEDGASYRYAVANLGGADLPDVLARFDALGTELGFELEPVV